MNEYTFKVSSNCLLSKHGFRDGDLFSDFIYDNDYDVRWTDQDLPIDKEVLKRVIEKYLLPQISCDIRLKCFVTQHNSVRVHPDDFEKLSQQQETIVEVTEKQLREICEEVKKEYVGEYKRIGDWR